MRRTNQNRSIGTGSGNGTSSQSSDQRSEAPSFQMAKTPTMFSLRLNLSPKKDLSIEYVLCEARLKLSIEHIRAYTDCSNPRDEIGNCFAL
jgi:hypothetical protein